MSVEKIIPVGVNLGAETALPWRERGLPKATDFAVGMKRVDATEIVEQQTLQTLDDEMSRWAWAFNSVMRVERAKGREEMTIQAASAVINIKQWLDHLYHDDAPKFVEPYGKDALGAGFAKPEENTLTD